MKANNGDIILQNYGGKTAGVSCVDFAIALLQEEKKLAVLQHFSSIFNSSRDSNLPWTICQQTLFNNPNEVHEIVLEKVAEAPWLLYLILLFKFIKIKRTRG